MADDPVSVLSDLLGDMATRIGEYTAIWQSAAQRNANNDYDTSDVVADVLKASGLVTRDLAGYGATLLAAFGVAARGAASPPAKKAPAKKVPAKKVVKKAPEKKVGAKKAAARKKSK